MKFEEILPILRTGKNARRKNHHILSFGTYFVKLEKNRFDFYSFDKEKQYTIYIVSGLNTNDILADDWEIYE